MYYEAEKADLERYVKDIEMIDSQVSPTKSKKKCIKNKLNIDVKFTDRTIFTSLTDNLDLDKYLDVLGYRL